MLERIRLADETDGATAVEYALLVAMIAAVVVGTIAVLGQKMPGLFEVQF